MEENYQYLKDLLKKLKFLSDKDHSLINQRMIYEKNYSFFPRIYSSDDLFVYKQDYINIDIIDLRKYKSGGILSSRYLEFYFDPSESSSIVENKIYLPFKIEEEMPKTLVEFSLQYGRIPEYFLKNIKSVNVDITRLCCEYMWRE